MTQKQLHKGLRRAMVRAARWAAAGARAKSVPAQRSAINRVLIYVGDAATFISMYEMSKRKERATRRRNQNVRGVLTALKGAR